VKLQNVTYKTPEEQSYIYMCMYLTLFSKDINNESVRSSAFFFNRKVYGKCASKFSRRKRRESYNVKKKERKKEKKKKKKVIGILLWRF